VSTTKKHPKLAEIAPGEIRTVCWTCGTPVGKRALFCTEHQGATKKKPCEKCGKAARGKVCVDCLGRRKTEEPILLHPSQIKGGKRYLTEHDRPFVEKWWAEGVKSGEIARRLDLSTINPCETILTKRRQRGWNLPYRKPQNVASAYKMLEKRELVRA